MATLQPTPTDDQPILFAPLGDAALLARFPRSTVNARQRAVSLAAVCRERSLPGVTDVVAAFDAVAVYYNPLLVTRTGTGSASRSVEAWLASMVNDSNPSRSTTPGVHVLPVSYGSPWSPDLARVAEHAGLSTSEVIALHQAGDYTVGAVGFAPGFAYLEGLPAALYAPRLDSPRPRVPAGSVAIAAGYTAVYPNDSPGGWNLIGRCHRSLFDPTRVPPIPFEVGDRIQFVAESVSDAAPAARRVAAAAGHKLGEPALRVASAGAQSTLQDLGRAGARAWGVSAGGAADAVSLRLANVIVGNPEDAVAIEATLVGPVLEFVADAVVGVAGGAPAELGGPRRLVVARGDRLDLRPLTSARVYVSIAGGFAAHCLLGGRGTDLQAGFGGLGGRQLRAGDVLLAAGGGENVPPAASSNWHTAPLVARRPRGDQPWEIRVMPGPHRDRFDTAAWRRLLEGVFKVSPQSSRMGTRCAGAAIPMQGAALEQSTPVAPGAIQVPPSGEPIVLGADCQTIGGYPVIACVASADLPVLGQLRPGERFRFLEVSIERAEQLLRDAEGEFCATAAGVRLAGSVRG